MGTEIGSKDYLTLLREDIPSGRDDLISTSRTLEDVAQHCLNSYDKSLEQTVNYTAQALGSVAYKINLLATNFLEVLDQQNVKLNGLQTKVNHLSMQVQIHQEKTARLSIGKYTLPRDPTAMRPSKVVEPIPEINGKYRRKEIDFSILDNVGHGVRDTQLSGSTVAYGSTSRRSSTSASGSETHSSNYAYTQANQGGSVGPKVGSDFIAKYGKVQTMGRSSGLTLNSGSGNIYRSPGTLPGKSQIPMASPTLTGNNNVSSPPPNSNYNTPMQYQQIPQGTRRSSSSSGANSSVISAQQKQYQTPPGSVVSPQKVPMLQQTSINAVPAYGYSGMNHPMAHIPPPPPPSVVNQSQEQTSASMMRYSELPPPPLEHPAPYQQPMTILPPPPPNVEQFNFNNSANNDQSNNDKAVNRFSTESIPIAHLQPNPYDSMRHKTGNDPSWVPVQYLCKVVTLYEYQQNKDDELSFQEQEIIYVVKKNNDGWWEGVMSDRTGLFPGNYVQVVN